MDEYKTVCTACKVPKDNCVFSPKSLQSKRPVCMACVSKRNKLAEKRIPSDPSRHWRNRQTMKGETATMNAEDEAICDFALQQQDELLPEPVSTEGAVEELEEYDSPERIAALVAEAEKVCKGEPGNWRDFIAELDEVAAPIAPALPLDPIAEVRKWLPNAPDDEWVKKHCPIELSFAERMLAALRENREMQAQLAECYKLSGADPDGNEDKKRPTRNTD